VSVESRFVCQRFLVAAPGHGSLCGRSNPSQRQIRSTGLQCPNHDAVSKTARTIWREGGQPRATLANLPRPGHRAGPTCRWALAAYVKQCVKVKDTRFSSLMHHIAPALLTESFMHLKRAVATGVDGVTWRDYEERLAQKITALWDAVCWTICRSNALSRQRPAPAASAMVRGCVKLREEVTKALECEPQRWKIIEHVREKFSCRDCEAMRGRASSPWCWCPGSQPFRFTVDG
jgi:hypothetical protein